MTTGFKAGTIMCVMNGPWQVADHLTGEAFADPSNLIIAPIPEGTAGNTGSPVGGHNYVVYALVGDDPAKEAAVLDLLSYINGTDAQAYLAQTLGLLPTRNSAYANEAVAADPVISAWGEVMQKATNRAGHPKSSDMYAPYSQRLPGLPQRRDDRRGGPGGHRDGVDHALQRLACPSHQHCAGSPKWRPRADSGLLSFAPEESSP